MSLKPVTIKINPVYASAVSQMTTKAYQQLKQSINKEGLHYTIVVNQDYVLLDGHHRYKACEEIGRPITEYDIEVKHFDDTLEERKFVHTINLLRRHLTAYQEAEEVCKIEQIEAEKAAKRQLTGKKIPLSSFELKVSIEEKGQARDIAIKNYGATISSTTYTRAKKIMDSTEVTEEQKRKLRENKLKINTIYQAIRSKEIRQERVREATDSPTIELPMGSELICGDFRDVCKKIPDNSIDLIFTDPPYDKESLPKYRDLGELAGLKLKKNGSLVTYCSQFYMDECMELIKQGSNYEMKWLWLMWIKHGGHHELMKMPGLRVWVYGKPLLWFTKGEKRRADPVTATPDFIKSEPPDKNLHDKRWNQSTVEAEHMIDVCTVENQIVLDPMMGSGTTGIASLKLKRKFIGVEIIPERFKVAEANISKSISFRESY